MGFLLKQSVRSLRSVAVPALAGLVVFGLAACGDDPAGPDVSQQQAEELAGAVSNAVFQGFFIALGQGGGAASRAPEGLTPWSNGIATTISDGSYTFDGTASCPEGGSLSMNGNGSVSTTQGQNSTTTDWDWNAQASYTSCGVGTDQGGTFVLDTSSPIQFTGSGSVTSDDQGTTTGSFTWSYDGTFDWNEQGGPSGNCNVDLTTALNVQSSQNTIQFSGSVNGTACGRDISRSFSATFTG